MSVCQTPSRHRLKGKVGLKINPCALVGCRLGLLGQILRSAGLAVVFGLGVSGGAVAQNTIDTDLSTLSEQTSGSDAEVPAEGQAVEKVLAGEQGASNSDAGDALQVVIDPPIDPIAAYVVDRETGQMLAGLYRRLYEASASEERSALLSEMLSHGVVEVFSMGATLAEGMLLNAEEPGPAVAEAALARVADDLPLVRKQACVLLENLNPAGAAAAVAGQFQRERDPQVAAAQLRLLARADKTSPMTVEAAMKHIGAPGPAFGPATNLLSIAARKGQLTEAHTRELLEQLRAVPRERITPATLGLIAQLSSAHSLEEWLGDPRADIVRTAATIMANDPGTLDVVLAHTPALAAQGVDVKRTVLVAIAEARPTAEGFAQAVALVINSTAEDASVDVNTLALLRAHLDALPHEAQASGLAIAGGEQLPASFWIDVAATLFEAESPAQTLVLIEKIRAQYVDLEETLAQRVVDLQAAAEQALGLDQADTDVEQAAPSEGEELPELPVEETTRLEAGAKVEPEQAAMKDVSAANAETSADEDALGEPEQPADETGEETGSAGG